MWYYLSNGQQLGPVTDERFNQMIAAGPITLDTLVWKEGQAEWLPLRQARPEFTGADACESCHRVVGADQLVDLDGVRVCAACKPAVVQKMREGVPVVPAMKAQRPVMVWVISLFYFICTPFGLLSFLLFPLLSSGALPIPEVQRHYFQSQNLFDYFLMLSSLVLNLTGAIYLFRLRRPAFTCFATVFGMMIFNFGYQIAFKNWLGVMAAQPGGYVVAGISVGISVAINVAIVWYVWHLKNTNVLR